MRSAWRWPKSLAARQSRPGHEVVDHHTWVFLGDGCLMEGISHEACSLAGTLGLGKLICIYDDNGISIDGKVQGWFTDDTPKRFAAYGWQVIKDVDGHDGEAVAKALKRARARTRSSRRCLLQDGDRQGRAQQAGHEGHARQAHRRGRDRGDPGRTRLELTAFIVPDGCGPTEPARAGAKLEEAEATLQQYRREHPELAAEFERRMKGVLPRIGQASCSRRSRPWAPSERAGNAGVVAGRAECARRRRWAKLLGGSADLTGRQHAAQGVAGADGRRRCQWQLRLLRRARFAMTAMMNGIALHGGFIPYAGTFLLFSDYAQRGALAALMQQRVVLVYTHD
ncbi:MAG: thiamine pyrophosphate-dependent enzyme [Steroidobacteraceae bacterium]